MTEKCFEICVSDGSKQRIKGTTLRTQEVVEILSECGETVFVAPWHSIISVLELSAKAYSEEKAGQPDKAS